MHRFLDTTLEKVLFLTKLTVTATAIFVYLFLDDSLLLQSYQQATLSILIKL